MLFLSALIRIRHQEDLHIDVRVHGKPEVLAMKQNVIPFSSPSPAPRKAQQRKQEQPVNNVSPTTLAIKATTSNVDFVENEITQCVNTLEDPIINSFTDVRSSNTPMDKENPWGKDGTRKDVDLYLYRSMIGSLMYLTASRPDVMFSVCACARHQVTPKECHLHAVKRIFRYLKGHPKLGLCDYGGATQDCKSTTKGCQFLGRRLISWQCKKQIIMATSTTEAEYVAAASCCGQVL
nr:hypothetical protein [Tanacetum cinerariifolium]